MTDSIENYKKIRFYIEKNGRRCLRKPAGRLRYPFIDPAATAYRNQMWDWDSCFCGLGLLDIYDDSVEYVVGCVRNFLSFMRKDGSIPYAIRTSQVDGLLPAAEEERRSPDTNSMKPLLAQMILMAANHTDDNSWIQALIPEVERHIAHWERTQQLNNGLFVWASYRGSGTDNHPAVYGRPLNSSVGVELNCFMYLEYKAMAMLYELLVEQKRSTAYTRKAEALALAINTYMWDEPDGLYYHLDALSKKPPLAVQDVTWEVPLKFRSWTCFMPMYAGIASEEQARRMVEEHIMNEGEFWSAYGIRTMAKCEKCYSTTETSNPSNWQGPVWILPCYFIYQGLVHYGYFHEAAQLAVNVQNALARDIEENGTIHEYYNPETGRSSINPDFLNWNTLAVLMCPDENLLRQEGMRK